MVDEFQDTNPRQLGILAALDRGNLFTVGDELQSIYGFRHADVQPVPGAAGRARGTGGEPAPDEELPQPRVAAARWSTPCSPSACPTTARCSPAGRTSSGRVRRSDVERGTPERRSAGRCAGAGGRAAADRRPRLGAARGSRRGDRRGAAPQHSSGARRRRGCWPSGWPSSWRGGRAGRGSGGAAAGGRRSRGVRARARARGPAHAGGRGSVLGAPAGRRSDLLAAGARQSAGRAGPVRGARLAAGGLLAGLPRAAGARRAGAGARRVGDGAHRAKAATATAGRCSAWLADADRQALASFCARLRSERAGASRRTISELIERAIEASGLPRARARARRGRAPAGQRSQAAAPRPPLRSERGPRPARLPRPRRTTSSRPPRSSLTRRSREWSPTPSG